MKKIMVCLWGRMGSGKSYLAKHLKDELMSKDLNSEIVTTSVLQKTRFDEWVKKRGLPEDLAKIAKLRYFFDQYLKAMESGDTEVMGLNKRVFLQTYGTEYVILNGSERRWVRFLINSIKLEKSQTQIYINDGCRFEHEIDELERAGFELIHVKIDVSRQISSDTYHERYGDSEYVNIVKSSVLNHHSDIAHVFYDESLWDYTVMRGEYDVSNFASIVADHCIDKLGDDA